MSPSCIESGYNFTFPAPAYGILGLVPVMPGIFHTDNGFRFLIYFRLVKAADSHKIMADLILLKLQLLFICQCLQLTAAALPVISAFRLHAKRGRCYHLLHSGISIILFYFHDPGFHHVSRHCVLYKKRKAIGFSDAFPLRANVVDSYRHSIVFLNFHIFSTSLRCFCA